MKRHVLTKLKKAIISERLAIEITPQNDYEKKLIKTLKYRTNSMTVKFINGKMYVFVPNRILKEMNDEKK